jgi:transcription elongation factor Elf1
VKEYHSDTTFPCKRCDAVFNTHGKLFYHVRKMHMPTEHVCGVCDQRFISAALLDRHEAVKHNNAYFECSECGKTFANHATGYYHLHHSHGHLFEHLMCEVCGDKCRTQRSLMAHMAKFH